MSDLEDDVLMQLIETAKRLDRLQGRADLIEVVWKALDKLVRALLKDPMTAKAFERELLSLRKSVEAVLTFDNEHSGGV